MIKTNGTRVEFTVDYGINGMIDCRRLADLLAGAFTEKTGSPIKGDINPGDSCCGIELECASEERAAELVGILESRLEVEENGNLRRPRDIFPLGSDIIEVQLPPREKDGLRHGLSRFEKGTLTLGTWGEDREESTQIQLPADEREDYLKGQVLYWIGSEQKEREEVTVHAAIIPESRLEEIFEDLTPKGIIETNKAMAEIGKASSSILEAPFRTNWGEIGEVKIEQSQPQEQAKKLEAEPAGIKFAARTDNGDLYMIDNRDRLLHQQKGQAKITQVALRVSKHSLEEIKNSIDTVKKRSTTAYVEEANEQVKKNPPAYKSEGAMPTDKPDVDDAIKYFRAVLGKARLPKAEWKECEAKMAPHIAKGGGLKKDAWAALKGNQEVVKLAQEHRACQQGSPQIG